MRWSSRRVRPDALLDSFLGLLDIKLGAEIILLFGLINKVAGIYGLITIFVGGSFAQLAYYAYSIATLFVFLWMLQTIKSEQAKPNLLVSHLYTLDHAILWIFHYLFFYQYWYVEAHDGRRRINSQAQQDLINLAISRGEIEAPDNGSDSDMMRVELAEDIWRKERVYAVWTLAFGLLLKVYFILILYSYAAHLRHSTYHALPLTSRSSATKNVHPTTDADLQAEETHEELEMGASEGEAGKGNGIVVAQQQVEGEEAEDDWE